MSSKTSQRKYDATLKLVNKVYDQFPAFTDVFDEETWYIFAAVFTGATILAAVIASRFIKLKNLDWSSARKVDTQALLDEESDILIV